MKRNGLSFIQNYILPPSMHYKWKEISDSVCKESMENHSGSTPDGKIHGLRISSGTP